MLNEIFTKNSPYPFKGEFEGIPLKNVPASKLLWLYRNNRSGRLKDYILENFEKIEKKALKEPKKRNRKKT